MIDPFAHKYSDAPNGGSTTLTVNGLHCTFNMPEAVKRRTDSQGNEMTVGLPPGAPRIGYPVDKFPASPTSWMHGSGKASSYFVPILPERGMWLDFNGNNYHSHHVAVVVSVQGVNPLTGMKVDPIRLEQYKNKCPKHGTDFLQNRFCESCGFEWHPQNYLSSNNGSPFWLDGFRTEDGTVRQWYFTEEECKGVAAQLIGEERVFAIGIAFYLSKNPKPVVRHTRRSYGYACGSLGGGSPFLASKGIASGFKGFAPSYEEYDVQVLCSANNAAPTMDSMSLESVQTLSADPTDYSGEIQQAEQASIERSLKKIEIGAGAKIYQKINADPENLDFWQDEPAGMIYINYCDVATAERILAAGPRKQKAEGFLDGLKLKS